jgi:hypothetical protein
MNKRASSLALFDTPKKSRCKAAALKDNRTGAQVTCAGIMGMDG